MLVKLCFDTVVNQHTSCTIYFLTDEHMRKTRLAFPLYGQFPSYVTASDTISPPKRRLHRTLCIILQNINPGGLVVHFFWSTYLSYHYPVPYLADFLIILPKARQTNDPKISNTLVVSLTLILLSTHYPST